MASPKEAVVWRWCAP